MVIKHAVCLSRSRGDCEAVTWAMVCRHGAVTYRIVRTTLVQESWACVGPPVQSRIEYVRAVDLEPGARWGVSSSIERWDSFEPPRDAFWDRRGQRLLESAILNQVLV